MDDFVRSFFGWPCASLRARACSCVRSPRRARRRALSPLRAPRALTALRVPAGCSDKCCSIRDAKQPAMVLMSRVDRSSQKEGAALRRYEA
jgi:hypothetical protein